jgi:predicted RNase H-like nuclease (RuvC/YqgF family)
MSITELTQKIETQAAQNETLASELSAAKEIIAATSKQIADAKAETEQVTEKLTAAQAENAKLAADLAAEKENVTKLTAERDEAKLEAAKARETGARYGAPAPTKPSSTGAAEPTTPAQIKAHYATLEGEERFAFFQKHKQTLLS